ncbi:hypothetical protein [Sphingopyxis sp. FD7]|uniref:hypothetical protein n=1 Tax=Sphingopyxis sp. FD7 TaxID=1914525 RepID=UPI000DC621AE|nr:hypothetical protein [Sphingopyxis sp. FD7]BBB11973.1 hypothetical protein SPYCA_1231 [Sphingopyxis sp. FD7]
MKRFWTVLALFAVAASTQSRADDGVVDNKDIVQDHLKSVMIANFIKKDFSKHVKHLGPNVLVGIQENGQGPVKYAEGPNVVEGIYDIITTHKKYPLSATCQKTATDKGPLEDLVMCYLLVQRDQGAQAKVQMFYGLEKGKIDRMVMAKVEVDNASTAAGPTKPAGQN